MRTPNTFMPMRENGNSKPTASQYVQETTYRELKRLVNMYGAELSVYSH